MLDLTTTLDNSQLGKTTEYVRTYNPSILFPISRALKRLELNVLTQSLPFFGYDLWRAYELSWLNNKGKPVVATAQIIFPCDTPNIIESKSMKLYFNSLNNTAFASPDAVAKTIDTDLSKVAMGAVDIKINPIHNRENLRRECLTGQCIDDIDISTHNYQVNPDFLRTENENIEETLLTHLFNSLCLATGQPDWASMQIQYQGKKINQAGLLKYLISYRNHREFHEQCIERAFMDILEKCQPDFLTIRAYFTRRGGIDIHPIRSTQPLTDSLPH